MNIFNSLGSNYNFSFVVKTLFSKNNPQYITELKNILSEKFGGKVILTYKGREAIELALKSLNLPKNSAVAITGFTCFAVYEAIKKAGLEVDYLDIEKDDLNFSPTQLKNLIQKNPQIKVVIVQNTLGYPCQIEKIKKICQEKKIFLIEDLAHSIGTKYENRQFAGTVGDFTALSFSQDKMIDAVSGGALIIRNQQYQVEKKLLQKDEVKDRIYPLFTYLIRNTYSLGLGKIIHAILKMFNLLSKPMNQNSEIKTIAPWYCYLISEEFKNLESNLNHRKKIAETYAQNLDKKILFPKLISNIQYSTNLRFPIFVENRANLIKHLKDQGIYLSDIWYDAPIAPKKFLSQTNYQNQCPNAENISDLILNLPTHINASEENALKISQLINQWLKLS